MLSKTTTEQTRRHRPGPNKQEDELTTFSETVGRDGGRDVFYQQTKRLRYKIVAAVSQLPRDSLTFSTVVYDSDFFFYLPYLHTV
jgi:hypothetical protein